MSSRPSCAAKAAIATVSTAALFSFTPLATAAGTDPAAAQALFDEAKQLVLAGNVVAACPKFEESQRLDPALGTVLNLADCYEKEGRTASAWSRFVEAESTARAERHPEVAQFARERAARLEPRLSKIVIQVSGPIPQGFELKRDDIVVGSAQWGAPIPVNPGSHMVVATAPSRMRWEQKIDLTSSSGTVIVRVAIPEPNQSENTTPPTGSSTRAASEIPGSSAATLIAASEPHDESTLSGQEVAALVVAGVGVGGVAIGSIFGLQSISKHNQAFHGTCNDNNCTAERASLSDARTAGNISTVGFIVGAAGLGAGALLWWTVKSGTGTETAHGFAETARLAVRPGQVSLEGTW